MVEYPDGMLTFHELALVREEKRQRGKRGFRSPTSRESPGSIGPSPRTLRRPSTGS
jgi:hypothetical protein